MDGSAGRFLVLVDAPKVAATSLDAWGVLPVAAVPFAAEYVALALADLSPARRPGRSDDGLAIIDLTIPAGADWEDVDARVRGFAGIVDTGLFRVRAGRCAGRRPGRHGADPAPSSCAAA